MDVPHQVLAPHRMYSSWVACVIQFTSWCFFVCWQYDLVTIPAPSKKYLCHNFELLSGSFGLKSLFIWMCHVPTQKAFQNNTPLCIHSYEQVGSMIMDKIIQFCSIWPVRPPVPVGQHALGHSGTPNDSETIQTTKTITTKIFYSPLVVCTVVTWENLWSTTWQARIFLQKHGMFYAQVIFKRAMGRWLWDWVGKFFAHFEGGLESFCKLWGRAGIFLHSLRGARIFLHNWTSPHKSKVFAPPTPRIFMQNPRKYFGHDCRGFFSICHLEECALRGLITVQSTFL